MTVRAAAVPAAGKFHAPLNLEPPVRQSGFMVGQRSAQDNKEYSFDILALGQVSPGAPAPPTAGPLVLWLSFSVWAAPPDPTI